MAQSADDDTIRITRPAAPAPRKSIPTPLIAAPIALIILVMGGWLVWRHGGAPAAGQSPVETTRAVSVMAARPALPAPATERSTSPGQPPIVAMAPGPAPAPVPAMAPNTVPSSVLAMAPSTEPAEVKTPADMKPPTPTVPPTDMARPLPFDIEAGNEQTILDHVATAGGAPLTIFHFKPNPRILVLDFTSLREQGRMLNRTAAFVEKLGLPHDRLLNDVELAAAVHASGDTVETYYYGHDYGSQALERFFAMADRDNVRLVPEEDELRDVLNREGWFNPGARAALISVPQVGADENVTRTARETILHHELSHGEYFSDPAYAAFVHHFWTQTLTVQERDRIRAHLKSIGYDPGLDEVMENEAQAYLMFTYSPQFFTPEMVGMSRTRLNELRAGFYKAMPSGWLRDSLGQYLNTTTRSAVSARP